MLSNKKIILGISGSIAAYRSLELIRLLRQRGASVFAMATQGALEFITQLSIQTLTGQKPSGGIEHIESAYEGDALLIAPATANMIAKMAHGIADNTLLQTYLSFTGPVLLAPAMEAHMWQHPATQDNIALLKKRGVRVIEPEEGPLASGRTGVGRLADLEVIIEATEASLSPKDFQDVSVLLTAGPTIEELDPVRYISNYSSGKMGVSLAKALVQRGAQVSLVHGPLQVSIPKIQGLKLFPVKSALDMMSFCLELSPKSNLAILCAAVADFKPANRHNEKIKKSDSYALNLTVNPDILKTLGSQKSKPFLVGFAAETEDLEANAVQKCIKKCCDLICGNQISASHFPFGDDDNQMIVADQSGVVARFERQDKLTLAHKILDLIRPSLASGAFADS
ncbi:MAG: bifunctional phosphopantothenoylcysteine decarboxylase/phosphopantothenate--cysteine ligase CoaBC [Myxococcota bacterium]